MWIPKVSIACVPGILCYLLSSATRQSAIKASPAGNFPLLTSALHQ
ncbi:hypothetical protein IGB42_02104 [Andreprevotia sp. IGB-42]|nr:hypothetical protein IGB42_02104 [Andreprevotia sp. IGB-42]